MEKQNKTTERLTDKAFSRLLLTAVLGILVCMLGLFSATWAWYEAGKLVSVSPFDGEILGIDVSVVNASDESVSVTLRDDGASVASLAPGLYTVTLSFSDDTTAQNGFCTLRVNGKIYRTDSVSADDSEPFTFTLDAGSLSLNLTFTPSWGIPSDPDVDLGGTLPLAPSDGAGN